MRLIWLSVVLGLAFVVIAASCGTTPRCSQATCPTGCCDASGLCKPGSSSSQCGRNGSSCTACLLGQMCDLGSCTGGFNTGAGTAGAGTGGGGFVTNGGSASGGAAGGGLTGGGAGGGLTGGGSGGGATVCNTTTCPGCCDFAGMCQPGISTNACGSPTATNGVCVQCGSGQVCSAGTCTTGAGGGAGGGAPSCTNGCLFSGQCLQAGSTMQNNSLCGNFGSTCRACTSPTPFCVAGFCQPSAAGGGVAGGGAAGGGSPGGGGAGGGAPPCPPLTLPTSLPGGSFSLLEAGYELINPGAYNFANFNTTDQLIGFELVRPMVGSPPTPYSGTITTMGYNSCQNCVQYAEGCTSLTPNINCARRFLAQAGNYSITTATESATTGSFVGTVTGVTFREWNFMGDSAVVGGRCYTLAAASFSGAW